MTPYLIIVAATYGFDASKTNTDSEKFVADTKLRAERMKTVRMTVTGKTFVPKEQIEARAAEEGVTHLAVKSFEEPYSGTILVDFARPLVQIDTRDYVRYGDGRSPSRQHVIRVLSNGEMKGLMSNLETPDQTIGVHNRKFTTVELDYRLEPFLYSAGRLQLYQSRIELNKPIVLPDADEWKVVNRIPLRGRLCTVFELERKPDDPNAARRYWIDLERQSCVMRFEASRQGQPVVTIDFDNERVGEFWIATRWNRKSYSQGKMVEQHERRAQNIVLNDPLEPHLIDVKFKPGMTVERDDGVLVVQESGEMKMVKKSQTPAERISDAMRNNEERMNASRSQSPPWGSIAIVAAIILGFAVIVYYVRIRRSKQHTEIVS